MQQRGSAVALYQAAGKVLAFLGRRKKVVCESNINISLGFVQTLQHADHQDEMPGSQQHTRLPTPFLMYVLVLHFTHGVLAAVSSCTLTGASSFPAKTSPASTPPAKR